MPRRKRTLPIASASGSEPTVSITSQDWNELEAALGQPIPSRLRTELISFTNNFLSFAVFELTVEPIDGTEARIKALSNTANAFWRTLFSGGSSDAAFYANHLIALHFHESRIGEQHKFHTLTGVMTSFVVACEKAQEEIDSGNLAEHQSGECWKGWILNVTRLLRENNLPVEARKDTDKNKGKASPFVRFIDRLQNCFDKKYRRGIHSPTALTQAIVRARRVTKPKPSKANKTRQR